MRLRLGHSAGKCYGVNVACLKLFAQDDIIHKVLEGKCYSFENEHEAFKIMFYVRNSSWKCIACALILLMMLAFFADLIALTC